MNHPGQTGIKDSFGRTHDYLRISVTENCNLRCSYCMPAGARPKPRSTYMSAQEMLSIASVFVELGVKKIRLTGGEPLLRSDAHEIIHNLSALPVELALSTNGVFVHQFIRTLKECGVRSVNISIDSLHRDKQNHITGGRHAGTILSNLGLLLAHGFHVKVNAVVMRGVNERELCDFVALTRNDDVHVRFIEYMPFNGNSWEWRKGFSYNEMIRNITACHGDSLERLGDKPNDNAKNYRIRGYRGTFAVISTVTEPFCDTCNRIRLTADGKLKNCLFSNSETDLLGALRRGEDIRDLIVENVFAKASRRGGMETFAEFSDPALHAANRCMTAIGG